MMKFLLFQISISDNSFSLTTSANTKTVTYSVTATDNRGNGIAVSGATLLPLVEMLEHLVEHLTMMTTVLVPIQLPFL